jgi:hypothetical protein
MDGIMNREEKLQAYRATQESLSNLEAEITELWGHINAANYRFLKLLAEFDRREGYARHGLGNTAHWLNWQCGIGAVAARERVRVARALESLPMTSAAFEKGQISYSKVRAMTRLATPENESELLNIALYGTAHHIESLVRRYRRARRAEEAARSEALHRDRYLRLYADWDGALVIDGKLPPELGALVKQALEAVMTQLESDASPDGGLNKNKTQSNVSAETFADDSARERVAEPIAARRADALIEIAQQALGSRDHAIGSVADRYQVVVHIDEAALTEPDTSDTEQLQRCEVEGGPSLAIDTAKRLACGGALVGIVESRDGDPLDVGRRTRAIMPALKRALETRDGGCRFPGCTHKRFTEGHHVKHWAHGGETKLSNLSTLCRFHHRLVHEGGFGLKTTDDGLFVFTRPDGSRINDAGPETGGAVLPLFDINRANRLDIDAETSRCRWQGETMDYFMAAEAIYRADHPEEYAPNPLRGSG